MKARIVFFIVSLFIFGCQDEPIQKHQQWCLSQSNCTEDEQKNVESVYSKIQSRPERSLIPIQIKKITNSDKSYLQKLLDIKKVIGESRVDAENFKKLSKIWQQIDSGNQQANISLFRKNKLEKSYRKFVKTNEMPSFYSSVSKYDNEIDIKSLLMDFEKNNKKAVNTLDFEVNKIFNFLNFPLRIGVVIDSAGGDFSEASIRNTVGILNAAFADVFINFDLIRIDTIHSDLKIEDLSEDFYEPYRQFSKKHDLEDTISVFFFSHRNKLCEVTEHSVSCSKQSGFSYVLSEETNNIVLNSFDLNDHKIIVHEFGHFFGLYHTFENSIFGKETIDGNNCETAGDRICDTPADPGNAYEVYVNYSKCEMIGNVDATSGLEYKPLINNYMSYYHPCYLKAYEFTPQQLNVIFTASRSPIRLKFADRNSIM